MAAEEKGLQKREQQALAAIQGDLQKLLPALSQALPETMKKYLTPERCVKVAMLAIRKSPLLAQCTKESILQCVMDSASLGLDVGGMLGHAYMVPFKNNKKGIYESQLIVGYKGLISLARRSGEILSVKSEVVYENDEFDVDLASGEVPKHRPYLKGDRGKPYLVYCVARFRDGGNHTEVMTLADCEKIRQRSKAKDAGPWANKEDFLEMCKKTVTRRAAKYWPLSSDTATDIAQAVEVDEKSEGGGDFINASFSVVGELPAARSRADEVFDKLAEELPNRHREDEWRDEEPQVPVGTEPAAEEALTYLRTRWAEIMPDARTDKDILGALKGLGIERDALGKATTDDVQRLLKHFDRGGSRPAAQE